MSERYILNSRDRALLSSAGDLLTKVATAETTTPAQLVTLCKLRHVLSVLPRVTTGVTASVSVNCPRHQFDDVETHHWYDFAIDDGELRVSAMGSFYRPTTGSDTFTTMVWCAFPGEPAELEDFRESLWMVPDARSFTGGVESIDLATAGYTVEILDDNNALLEEEDDDEVDESPEDVDDDGVRLDQPPQGVDDDHDGVGADEPSEDVAPVSPPPSGVEFDYGGFDFRNFTADLAANKSALNGKSTKEGARAGGKESSSEELAQAMVFRKGKMDNRLKTVGRIILGLLLLGGVATGIAAWFYHGHEVRLRDAETVAANEKYAKSVVAAVMKSWDAEDDWEKLLPSDSLYTMDVEKALISDRRLLVYGMIEDVKKSEESGNSIVSVQTQTRAVTLDLRLSLQSSATVTNAIVAHKGLAYETFVLAVKVDSVEKVSAPPNSASDDYFLAHGVLYEANPIGFYLPPAPTPSNL